MVTNSQTDGSESDVCMLDGYVTQHPSNTPTSDDCFTLSPSSGARYRTTTEGCGTSPTLSQTVQYDARVWRDAFDGTQTILDAHGAESRVADFTQEWLREALLSMRTGEIRRIITPGFAFAHIRLIHIVDSGHEGFVRHRSGAYHRVVQRGTGNGPTLNDTVRYDIASWRDGFDTDTDFEQRGVVRRVTDMGEWLRERIMAMREGETRRIILPEKGYVELRLASIMRGRPLIPMSPWPTHPHPHNMAHRHKHRPGALHQTIREGSPSGRTPTSIDQTVVYDYTTVGHGIGGRQQRLGEIRQLSDLHEWLREAMMAMREGEVRRIMLPCCSCEGGGTAAPYVELHLISIL
ncbi:unnamed protein product [Vitrella brassicaformis CCMP3155]|uniref:Uncharacterized protein n=1 Tax=Vitrella brassicaformis (strain CCMP3155) TaxID=1169540 RepID=A0A0G4H4W9_VITBC|nr:unnamed protein product [Vitrella brassicaformis CCMP3155]|eukprot:CEM38840.1 unnamed protein product [Vitrella brassicaformis CCMP3155]